jgi:sarcosine oxidase subunit gamma
MVEKVPIVIRPLRGTTCVRLQSWEPVQAFSLSGLPIPVDVGATTHTDPKVLCLGPTSWLITSRTVSPATVLSELTADARRQNLVLTDLSQAILAVEVQGLAARDLLSKGCGLDMHPRAFSPGQCARTRFAQIGVIVDCLTTGFELHVGRSYAPYLQSWLQDAAVEFG